MQLRYRKHDLAINLVFGLSLLFSAIPDLLLYDPADLSRFRISVLNTILDSTLLVAVFLFLKREIRHYRTARTHLENLNRQQSEFLQVVVHDLRNPLNAILQLAALLPPDPHQTPEFIRGTAKEMADIIDSMLDMASLEQGKIRLNPVESDLAEVVSEVLDRNRPHAEQKRIQLNFTTPQPSFANFDRGRIRQALDNLVSNAIKFSPPGKNVTITIRPEKNWVRVEVIDAGPGFTPEEKTKLFHRFERLSARPTGGESSIGLGLANARCLVELHGGHVGAESPGPGQGSRFWLELPIS